MTTKPIPRVIMISSLTGPQSGKSTIAKHLEENHGYKLVSFAGPIKRMVSTLLEEWYGVAPDDRIITRRIYGDLKETLIPGVGNDGAPVSARRLMQTLGTEWRNMVDVNLWVKIAIEHTKFLLGSGYGVVIDDLRFPHEYALFKKAFKEQLMHIAVTRPANLYHAISHASEDTSWITSENLDVSLVNDYELERLHSLVDAALETWVPRP